MRHFCMVLLEKKCYRLRLNKVMLLKLILLYPYMKKHHQKITLYYGYCPMWTDIERVSWLATTPRPVSAAEHFRFRPPTHHIVPPNTHGAFWCTNSHRNKLFTRPFKSLLSSEKISFCVLFVKNMKASLH